MGAWIEITLLLNGTITLDVAPLVGAWIEIDKYAVEVQNHESLPSWERGLKSSEQLIEDYERGRSPRGSVD